MNGNDGEDASERSEPREAARELKTHLRKLLKRAIELESAQAPVGEEPSRALA